MRAPSPSPSLPGPRAAEPKGTAPESRHCPGEVASLSGYHPRRNAGTFSLSQATPPCCLHSHSHGPLLLPGFIPASASSPCPPFSLPGTVQPSLRTTQQNSLSKLNSPTGVGKAGEAKTLQIKFKQFFHLVDHPCQPHSLLSGFGQQLRDPSQRLPG